MQTDEENEKGIIHRSYGESLKVMEHALFSFLRWRNREALS